jgi:predicted amidohydrolase
MTQKKRKFRVAVTCYRIYLPTRERKLDEILKMIDRTAEGCSPDVIVLSESVYERGLGFNGERIPGRYVEALKAKCIKYNCCIVANQFDRRVDDKIYNTNVFLDRQGNIAARYDKLRIPPEEAKGGVIAGEEFLVFDTEFGKVAMEICYDLQFPEVAEGLAKNGAEIIFVSTIGDYSIEAVNAAKDNNVFIAVAGQDKYRDNDYDPSIIVNNKGEVIASVIDRTSPHSRDIEFQDGDGSFCFADIDLGAKSS